MSDYEIAKPTTKQEIQAFEMKVNIYFASISYLPTEKQSDANNYRFFIGSTIHNQLHKPMIHGPWAMSQFMESVLTKASDFPSRQTPKTINDSANSYYKHCKMNFIILPIYGTVCCT